MSFFVHVFTGLMLSAVKRKHKLFDKYTKIETFANIYFSIK